MTRRREPADDNTAEKFLDSLPADANDPAPPDEPDEDDDDDEDPDNEADDDDDDDEPVNGPVPLSSVPPPAPRPPRPATVRPPRATGPRGPRNFTPQERATSPTLNRMREIQESAYQEVDALLASLNFSTRQYEVRVERTEPEYDENDVPCRGHLHTFREKITVDDIQRKFGGGKYILTIFGPNPATGRPGLIKQERLTIAGAPNPMKSKGGRKRDEDDERESIGDVLRVVSDSNERAQARMEKLIERTSGSSTSAITEVVASLQPMLQQFMEKGDLARQEQLEARREERERERAADERRREEERVRREEEREARKEEAEKRREEDRLRREDERRLEDKRLAEERKREEEKREAQREERERQREEREAERERMREEREREREAAKEAAAERQRQHDRDLATQKLAAEQDAKRQQEFMTMMQNFQNTQLQMLENRMESGGIEGLAEKLLMLKKLQGSLTGEDREPSRIDTIVEGAERIMEVITPAAKQFMSGRSGQPLIANTGQPQQQQQQPTRVIAVDLGPKRDALPNPAPAQQAPAAQPAQPEPAQPLADEPPTSTTDTPNDFTEFQFPGEGEDFKVTAAKLVKSVDLAVQRDMSAEEIVEKILVPFESAAPFVMNVARKWDEEELMEFIEEHVPKSWAILSAKGEEVVLEAFEAWQERE